MALEDLTGTKYIDSLVVTNPAAGDNVSEGDDHIRGIKNTIKNTFANVNGAVTATDEELNYVDGVTSNIQTQIDGKLADGDTATAMTITTLTSTTANITTVDLGDWTVTESSGVLYFATGGTNKMKLDASGNLTVVGDVTAYGTV